MATIKAFIRTTKRGNALCNIRLRLTDGRSIQLFGKSEILVGSADFDAKAEKVKARVVMDQEKRASIDSAIGRLKDHILTEYNKIDKNNIQVSWLNDLVDKYHHPEKYEKVPETLLDHYNTWLTEHKVSDNRRKQMKVLGGMLYRFGRYKGIELTLNNFTLEILKEFEQFLYNEHTLPKKHPSIYEDTSEKMLPKKRSRNRISCLLSMLRGFFNSDKIKKYPSPFVEFHIDPEVYGTPIYISKEERDLIYKCDLSSRPALAIQRDIFIFQCLIGCRVGDLMRFTADNIHNGVLSYIAHKTIEEEPITIEVPLSKTAKELIKKYKGGTKLFPFISEQKYNDAIKEAFTAAGITRKVAWLNPLTRKEELRPINEIASSHMARRTFIGNLYNKVQDANLIGSMSGHVNGSRSFSRYRAIDIETKEKIVSLID